MASTACHEVTVSFLSNSLVLYRRRLEGERNARSLRRAQQKNGLGYRVGNGSGVGVKKKITFTEESSGEVLVPQCRLQGM